MPRQRFRCPRCGFVDTFWYPTPVYDINHNRISSWPCCPHCTLDDQLMASDYELPPQMEAFPETMQHDLLTGGTGLTVQSADGGDVTVSSLREIRTIENESLRRARNGDGSPIVFRGFSQNRSNRHVNSFSGSSLEKNKSERIDPRSMKTTQGRPITAQVIPESQALRE